MVGFGLFDSKVLPRIGVDMMQRQKRTKGEQHGARLWPGGGTQRKGVMTKAGPGPRDDRGEKGAYDMGCGRRFPKGKGRMGCDFVAFGGKGGLKAKGVGVNMCGAGDVPKGLSKGKGAGMGKRLSEWKSAV